MLANSAAGSSGRGLGIGGQPCDLQVLGGLQVLAALLEPAREVRTPRLRS